LAFLIGLFGKSVVRLFETLLSPESSDFIVKNASTTFPPIEVPQVRLALLSVFVEVVRFSKS